MGVPRTPIRGFLDSSQTKIGDYSLRAFCDPVTKLPVAEGAKFKSAQSLGASAASAFASDPLNASRLMDWPTMGANFFTTGSSPCELMTRPVLRVNVDVAIPPTPTTHGIR